MTSPDRAQESPEDDERVDYGAWGEQFFEDAISEVRVLGAVNTIAGQPIDFGPIGVGPGRIAKVRAYGHIGQARATRQAASRTGGLIGYRVLLPVTLSFEVDLQVDTHKFDAQLLVPLTLTAVALRGVRIHIDAEPPAPHEVQVKVQATGLRASVLQRVVGLEDELPRFVSTYVARELDRPHVREARLIDVSKAIDSAWASIRPRDTRDHEPDRASGEQRSASATADLNEALEREIREHESVFLDGSAGPTGSAEELG